MFDNPSTHRNLRFAFDQIGQLGACVQSRIHRLAVVATNAARSADGSATTAGAALRFALLVGHHVGPTSGCIVCVATTVVVRIVEMFVDAWRAHVWWI